MSVIKLLPENLINQIAAGEVVERPASVVKELVENSLDAGATRITIEIEGGGEELIRITDNGCGMDKEDAVLALERHATSKISSQEDLSRIHTLGFRGEAISSIASVSFFTLQTKKRGDLEGTLVSAEGGKNIKTKSAGIPEGTQIEVKQLFFNTPARRKYLKSPATEYGHILDTVTGLALAFPEVAFRLVHNQKIVFDLPSQKNFLERIRTLMGSQIADELIPVFYGHSQMQLEGFIGKPLLARSGRSGQHLFINRRGIRSNSLSYAIKESYHSLLPSGKYPLFFLYYKLDPELIDVNVHPRKLEIRFRNEKELFLITREACSKALEKHVLSPNVKSGQSLNYYRERKSVPLQLQDKDSFHAPAPKISTNLVQDALQFSQELAQKGDSQPQTAVLLEKPLQKTFLERTNTEEIIPLAQLSNAFILCQQGKDLVLIDQHAAHERIRYTEILQDFAEQKKAVQPFLTPLQLEFSAKEILALQQNHEIFENLGFEIEAFGGNTFTVRAIPNYLAKENLQQTILGLLDDVEHMAAKGDFEKRKERSLIYMACRSAVKFGDPLSQAEQREIIKKLTALDLPYTCPHGRPTMITMSFDELKKRFGREYL
jgi:DNA mismatch repair protein MutL